MPCIYCGGPLTPDPVHTHWAHCGACSPTWHAHALELLREAQAKAYAAWAVADTRGNPTRGGVKR